MGALRAMGGRAPPPAGHRAGALPFTPPPQLVPKPVEQNISAAPAQLIATNIWQQLSASGSTRTLELRAVPRGGPPPIHGPICGLSYGVKGHRFGVRWGRSATLFKTTAPCASVRLGSAHVGSALGPKPHSPHHVAVWGAGLCEVGSSSPEQPPQGQEGRDGAEAAGAVLVKPLAPSPRAARPPHPALCRRVGTG